MQDDLDDARGRRRDLVGATSVFAALTPFDKGGLAAETRQIGICAARRSRPACAASSTPLSATRNRTATVAEDAIWGVERLLQEFDLPLTLLRPAFFMENLDEFALRRAADGSSVLRMPLDPRTTVQWIAVDDVGRAGAPRASTARKPSAPGLSSSPPTSSRWRSRSAMVGDELDAEVRYERIPSTR